MYLVTVGRPGEDHLQLALQGPELETTRLIPGTKREADFELTRPESIPSSASFLSLQRWAIAIAIASFTNGVILKTSEWVCRFTPRPCWIIAR
jgi:hypothetical protein